MRNEQREKNSGIIAGSIKDQSIMKVGEKI